MNAFRKLLGRSNCFALLLGGLLISTVQAQDFVTNVSNKGTVAAAFLEVGIGARAEAMGGSYAAQAGHVESIYWNPAGLAYVPNVATSFTHAEWLAEMDFDFFALSTPLPFANMVLGGSFTTLGVPEQPVRTVDAPEGTGEVYDARDFAVNVSVAAQLIPSFSVGVTGKYISQRIWTERGNQLALDVGVYYQTPLQGLSIGSSISNFGPDISLSGKNLTNIIDPDPDNRGIENIPVDYRTDAHPLPQIFRFGMAYERSLAGRANLVGTVDLMHPTGSTESMNLGLELGWGDLLFARAGYQNLYERGSVGGLTLGGGLQYRLRDRSRFVFDYAWSDWDLLERVHRLSFGLYL
ncbi:MAG: type IX secretion system outer membrane channel protein PorV [Rhodothermales bacterium]